MWVNIAAGGRGGRNDTQKLLCFASTSASPGEDITAAGEPASLPNHGALAPSPAPTSLGCLQEKKENMKQENKLIKPTQQMPPDCALGGKKVLPDPRRQLAGAQNIAIDGSNCQAG